MQHGNVIALHISVWNAIVITCCILLTQKRIFSLKFLRFACLRIIVEYNWAASSAIVMAKV